MEEMTMENNQESVEGKNGTLVVTVKKTQAGTVNADYEKREEIEVSRFVTTPALVTAGAGATLNMGNYESLRIDVRVSLPCYVEEIDGMYLKARDWVDERLSKEIEEVKAKRDAL